MLSDPLLRRDWDAKHAGPMRGHASPAPAKSRTSTSAAAAGRVDPRRTAAPPEAQEQRRPATAGGRARPPASARPRSSRAYTWSASEVPWWEEGTAAREKKRAQTQASAVVSLRQRRRPKHTCRRRDRATLRRRHDFDVYNRSSGAAWSMAARAYFRRGDQDLPSRGSFQYQGTQVLTAARARAAAEAEARQQAARAAREQPAPPLRASERQDRRPRLNRLRVRDASAGVARDPVSVGRAREQFLKRLRAQQLAEPQGAPALRAAWRGCPIAVLIGYGGTVGTGCDRGALGCPPRSRLVQAG